jgi:hypothetical protein
MTKSIAFAFLVASTFLGLGSPVLLFILKVTCPMHRSLRGCRWFN